MGDPPPPKLVSIPNTKIPIFPKNGGPTPLKTGIDAKCKYPDFLKNKGPTPYELILIGI